MLFVANANTNNLAVVNVKEPGGSAPLGFIPAGWYPTSVRLARDGKTIYVANGKGAARRRPTATARTRVSPARPGPTQRIHRRPLPGDALDHPDARPRGRWRPIRRRSTSAARCDEAIRRPSPDRAPRRATRSPRRSATPRRSSTVVYIIKENRTYDQVFGDMPEGNGEPSICLFPEAITPNHHALAREFVLLDNFYVESEVSADGHEWSMGAYASDFVERIWPLGYRGDRRVPYPSEGAPRRVARPAGGYLWDKAAEKGVSYRSYGEFVDNGKTPDRPRDRRRSRRSRATSTRCSAASTWTIPTSSAPTASSRSWPGSRRPARCPGW